MGGFEIIVPIVAILIGGTMFIVPIAGFTARFALKPLVESYAKMQQESGSGDRMAQVERRLALLEEQVSTLERENSRLLEEADFQRKLAAR
jgi:hypothetical protein